MCSIRAHLATSVPYDSREPQIEANLCSPVSQPAVTSIVQLFKQNLEAVDGHCLVVRDQSEVDEAIKRLTQGKLVGTSDIPVATRDLFNYEVGITRAQAGIAETGTLVLDSSVERNRLVSLVPPVHIAILDASRIYLTFGETLSFLQSNGDVSPAIT